MAVVTIRAKSPRAPSVVGAEARDVRTEVERSVEKKTRALLSVEADRVLVVYGEGGAHIYYEDGRKARA